MSEMDIVFFDTTYSQLSRFGNEIAKELKSIKQDIRIVGLCYEKKPLSISQEIFFDDLIFENNISNLEKHLENLVPQIMIFTSHRVPDLNMLLHAKTLGACTIELQHGVIYEGAHLNNFNYQEVFAATKKLHKTLKYLNIIKRMCNYDKISFAKMLTNIVLGKSNITGIVQSNFSIPLLCDYAMVIGQDWMNFYSEVYRYKKEQIFVMGNHDLDTLELKNIEKESAICYITNTVVEDGKVQKSKFDKFLKSLSESVPKEIKLYIKLHPRSNKTLYEPFFINHNVQYIREGELPYTTVYIGHNSTLISRALYISTDIILWWFKEEKELFFKDYVRKVCTEEAELKEAVNDVLHNPVTAQAKDIKYFSYKQPEGAFHYCASTVLQLLFKSK